MTHRKNSQPRGVSLHSKVCKSRLKLKLLVLQRKESQPAGTGVPKVWLPDGEVTLQPFRHPQAKRRRTSLASQPCNETSQRASQGGASVGADGSNEEPSKGGSTDSGKEQQSIGVSPTLVWRELKLGWDKAGAMAAKFLLVKHVVMP